MPSTVKNAMSVLSVVATMWTVLLAIIAFSCSLLGTFLVRSGVLTSVHSFAADPTRGTFVLVFLGIVVGGSLLLYALRAPQASASQAHYFQGRRLQAAERFEEAADMRDRAAALTQALLA